MTSPHFVRKAWRY